MNHIISFDDVVHCTTMATVISKIDTLLNHDCQFTSLIFSTTVNPIYQLNTPPYDIYVYLGPNLDGTDGRYLVCDFDGLGIVSNHDWTYSDELGPHTKNSQVYNYDQTYTFLELRFSISCNHVKITYKNGDHCDVRKDNVIVGPSDRMIGQITEQIEQVNTTKCKQHMDALKTKNLHLSELNDQLHQKIIEMEERYHSMADYLEADMQKFTHQEKELSQKEDQNKQLMSILEHKKNEINQKNKQIKQCQSMTKELRSTISELEQKYRLSSKTCETISKQCEDLSQRNDQLYDQLAQYEREKEKQTSLISKLEDTLREQTNSLKLRPSQSKHKQWEQKGLCYSAVSVIIGFCLYILLRAPLI